MPGYRPEFLDVYSALFKYILSYWHLTPDELTQENIPELRQRRFGLESCLTLLELQMADEGRSGLFDLGELREVWNSAVHLVTKSLNLFNWFPFLTGTDVFFAFAKRVMDERATVITLNYDTLLEQALQRVSGWNEDFESSDIGADGTTDLWGKGRVQSDALLDRQLVTGRFRWRPELAYGFQFDRVELEAPSGTWVDGATFYGRPENHPYAEPILKLHGSLNWIRPNPEFPSVETFQEQTNGNLTIKVSAIDLDPILPRELLQLKTPVPAKSFREAPFNDLYEAARESLRVTNRLVVVGYSFPATDFHINRLLMEAFAERQPDEVIVVNTDESVGDFVAALLDRRLTSFKGLAEFLDATSTPTTPPPSD